MANRAKVWKRDVVHYLMRERYKDCEKRGKLGDELVEILACYDAEKAKTLKEENDRRAFSRIFHDAREELSNQELSDIHENRINEIVSEDHDLDVGITLFDRLINYVDRMKGIKE